MALLFGADGKLVKITHQYANYAAAPAGCMTMALALPLFIMLVTVAVIALQRFNDDIGPKSRRYAAEYFSMSARP